MHLLDVTHWSLLFALKDQETLSAAAIGLGITQSAATQRLQEAERRLGVSLTHKVGRTLVLTEAGRILAQAAAQTQPILLQAENDAIWQGKRNSKRLRVAMSQFDPPALAMNLIEMCQRELPDLSAEITRVSAEGIVAAIRDKTADLALVPGKPRLPGLASRPVFSDKLVAIFSKVDFSGEAVPVQPQNFAGKTFLTYDLRPEPGWEYDSFFQRGRSFPAEAVKIESTELICRLVSQGSGASILPGLCIGLSDYADRLAAADLDCEPIQFEWHLIHAQEVPEHLLNRIAEYATQWPAAT